MIPDNIIIAQTRQVVGFNILTTYVFSDAICSQRAASSAVCRLASLTSKPTCTCFCWQAPHKNETINSHKKLCNVFTIFQILFTALILHLLHNGNQQLPFSQTKATHATDTDGNTTHADRPEYTRSWTMARSNFHPLP